MTFFWNCGKQIVAAFPGGGEFQVPSRRAFTVYVFC